MFKFDTRSAARWRLAMRARHILYRRFFTFRGLIGEVSN